MRHTASIFRTKATLSLFALGLTTILPSLASAAPSGIKRFIDSSEMTPDGASGCKLSYGKGPLISNVQAVPVFWSSKVDAGIQSWAPGYLAALVNSPYLDQLSEYNATSGGTGQKIGRGTATKGYVITPSSTATTNISNTTIGNELTKQITAGNLPQPVYDAKGYANTMFVVFFPKGYSLTLQGSKSCASGGFCAYHDAATVSGNDVPFAAIPDMSSGSGCDKGCQVCPTGDTVCSGSAENVAATSVSHEIAEAVTDVTNNSAWVDQKSACGEIGDICAATSAIDVDTGIVPGTTPPIYAQLEWSNAQNKCEMSNPTIGVQPGGGTTNPPACTAASCTGATPVCDATSGTCRGCKSNSECTAPTSQCNVTSGQCEAPTTGGQDAGNGGGGTDAGGGGGDTDAGGGGGTDDDSGTGGGGGGVDSGTGGGGGTGYDAGHSGSGKDAGKGGTGVDSGDGSGDGDDGSYDSGTQAGCSVSRGSSPTTFGVAGALFGLAALVRTRRRNARR